MRTLALPRSLPLSPAPVICLGGRQKRGGATALDRPERAATTAFEGRGRERGKRRERELWETYSMKEEIAKRVGICGNEESLIYRTSLIQLL